VSLFLDICWLGLHLNKDIRVDFDHLFVFYYIHGIFAKSIDSLPNHSSIFGINEQHINKRCVAN
jgi:hypothetical protein